MQPEMPAGTAPLVDPKGQVAGPDGTVLEPSSGIGMISIKPSTWALSKPNLEGDDDDEMDPDYVPSEAASSQSESDSEAEFIEE